MLALFSSANVNVCELERKARKTWDQCRQSLGDLTPSSLEPGTGALLLKVCSPDRGVGITGSVLEMQTVRPCPALRNQSLPFVSSSGPSHAPASWTSHRPDKQVTVCY